jgi:hypothetical protein
MPEDNQGQEQTQKPNVRLARGQDPVTVEGEVNIGATPGMFLPDEATQRVGFYVSHPHVLVTQYYPKYRYLNSGIVSRQAAKTQQPKEEASLDVGGDPVDRLTEQAEKTPDFKAENGGGSDAAAF